MIVKVNRVRSKDEVDRLLSVGVDIIGISLKLNQTNTDVRVLNLDELIRIQRAVSIPNLSLNLNINEYTGEDISYLSRTLKPNSFNLFIEASSIRDVKQLNKEQLQIIQTINDTKVDVISFGNGFGYDGPSTIPDSLGIYKYLKYEEINIDTLCKNSKQRIKSRDEWIKHLKVHNIEQSKFDSTILESITETMKERPFLVDDLNIETVSIEKLIQIGAGGITMSISNVKEDECLKNQTNMNQIAKMKDFEKIIEITKRIKEYGP